MTATTMTNLSVQEPKPARPLSAAVIGARGYAGRELVRLLAAHPAAELRACYGTGPFSWNEVMPFSARLKPVPCRTLEELEAETAQTYFLATPAEVSLDLAPKLLARGARVVDLSGAFRLKSSDYGAWYHLTHTEPKWLAEAHYGLRPFAGPSPSRLVANPGCYASAVLMGLVPLLRAELIDPASLVIDAKSGASGAGKKAAENLLFTEVAGDCLPYRVGRHQHLPEIIEATRALTGHIIDPHFSTHLLPVDRGLSAALYARVREGVTSAHVAEAYARAYADEALVRAGGCGSESALLRLHNVVNTPFTHLAFELTGDKLFVFSAIDNLLKGAASQAIENFNLLWDLPATTGLLSEGGTQ